MNKIAVISDIHGNIPAFEAVLEDIGQRETDRIICLGDLVGKALIPILLSIWFANHARPL